MLNDVTNSFIQILEGNYLHLQDIPQFDFPLYGALCETLFEFYQMTKVNQLDMTYFTECVVGYLKAVVWEYIEHDNTLPSQETYMFKRRHTIGFPYFMQLVYAMSNVVLYKEMRVRLLVQRYTEAVRNVLFLTNDILSLRKEIIAGEVENLVLLKRQELGLPQAFSYVKKLLNSEINEVVRIGNLLIKFSPDDKNIGEFVALTENYIDGHLYWYMDSKRYGDIQFKFKKVLY